MDPSNDQFAEKMLSRLRAAAVDLKHEVPNVRFGIQDSRPSEIYISALIMDADLELPDLVDLGIFFRLGSNDNFIQADVTWGAEGFGCVEVQFQEQPVLDNEENRKKLEADLPRLIEVLKAAVKRRKPYNWDERK